MAELPLKEDWWKKLSDLVTSQREQRLPDRPGGLPTGELMQSLLVPSSSSAAMQMLIQPTGMARAPRKHYFIEKTPSKKEAELLSFPSRAGGPMLPPEKQYYQPLPFYGPRGQHPLFDQTSVADIGDILDNYQQSTKSALRWMMDNPAAKELGYKEGESIPRNLRNIRNNAILRDDTRAMSTSDLPKKRTNKLSPETEKEISDFVDRYNANEGAGKIKRENLMRGEEEDMINAGEIPWEKVDKYFPQGGSLSPTVRKHLENFVDELPPSKEFLDKTQLYRTGERAGTFLDFLTEHRANKMALDDQMVRDMLTLFDQEPVYGRSFTPRSATAPRQQQGALPYYDKDARNALMDFYDKSQRYTPTVPLKRGEVARPTPEGGNAAFRDFRSGYFDTPEVQLPGSREPIGVRRYDTAAESPLPTFMLKRTEQVGTNPVTEITKPFVFDLNSPKTFDEVLQELMNSTFKLPPGVR